MGLALLAMIGFACIVGMMGFVYYKETHLPPIGDSNVIIVLGAQVKPDGTPSVALERRLTAALESYQADRQLIIVCGAQAGTEPRAEGDVMRDWLLERGVPQEDVVAETASFNTRENLTYAKAIMEHRGHGKGALNIDTTLSFTPLHGALLYSLSYTGAALALLACPCLRSCTPQRGAQNSARYARM